MKEISVATAHFNFSIEKVVLRLRRRRENRKGEGGGGMFMLKNEEAREG